MPFMRTSRSSLALAAALLSLVAPIWTRPAAAADEPAPPFCRVQESDDGQSLALEMAVRTYRRLDDPSGPSITLAGAIHIGDMTFYQSLQQRLDAMDIVLYEGVLPPGGGRPEHNLANSGEDQDAAKARTTTRRIRFLATLIAAHNRRPKAEPIKSLDQLADDVPDRMQDIVRSSRIDAWGQELQFTTIDVPEAERGPGKDFDLLSFGADGQPGGEGVNQDLRFSAQPPLTIKDLPKAGSSKGLQQQLAGSLGLVFQLDAMTHDKPNWRSSDLAVDQIQERVSARGGSADALFSTLEGTSIQAGVARLVLGLIKMLPAAQTYGKAAMMEVLTQAEDVTALAPGEMADLMPVIIHDRNAVVIADLEKVLANEPDRKSIGIIYGAGHMPGLVTELTRLDFVETGLEWVPAITINFGHAKGGVTAADIRAFRKTISQSLDQQIKAARKRKPE